jgi:hypothetical protein
VRGNLVDSVISASYRPNNGNYNAGTAGNGTITGVTAGVIDQTSTGKTVLGNTGSGFYALKKKIVVHPAGSNQAT